MPGRVGEGRLAEVVHGSRVATTLDGPFGGLVVRWGGVWINEGRAGCFVNPSVRPSVRRSIRPTYLHVPSEARELERRVPATGFREGRCHTTEEQPQRSLRINVSWCGREPAAPHRHPHAPIDRAPVERILQHVELVLARRTVLGPHSFRRILPQPLENVDAVLLRREVPGRLELLVPFVRSLRTGRSS